MARALLRRPEGLMTPHHMLLRALPAFAALTLASVLLAGPVIAAEPDVDGDGVADAADDCPDSAPGELVGIDGCEACPCEETVDGEPWKSKRAYVVCVAEAAKDAGLSRRARRALIRRAKRSTCGNESLTRCCLWPEDEGAPRCTVTTADKCEALGESHDVDDIGPGSCTPTACDE
jgi:hypothetical protein